MALVLLHQSAIRCYSGCCHLVEMEVTTLFPPATLGDMSYAGSIVVVAFATGALRLNLAARRAIY